VGTTRVFLLCRGGMSSWSLPPLGEPTVVAVVVRGEEYHVVAAVEGYGLETPEAEHRPGLARLLKSTHLELNGKVFINTQHAPTWRTSCRRFGPRGSLDRLVNFVAACPCLDGLVRDGTQGETSLVLYSTRVLIIGVTSVARERERESEWERAREREGLALPVFSRPFVVHNPFSSHPSPLPPCSWTSPFIDIRRWPSCTMGV
jgi:hypothetical protein